jgi:hypothetical protein
MWKRIKQKIEKRIDIPIFSLVSFSHSALLSFFPSPSPLFLSSSFPLFPSSPLPLFSIPLSFPLLKNQLIIFYFKNLDDATRVILSHGTNDYINANFISVRLFLFVSSFLIPPFFSLLFSFLHSFF